MRRLLAATIVVGVIAAAVTAWSVAAPTAGSRGTAPSAAAQPGKKKKAKLPPLPAAIKQRGRWNIGVKCDTPPFGYVNLKGDHAGYDVEIARWFSRFAFGDDRCFSISDASRRSSDNAFTGRRCRRNR